MYKQCQRENIEYFLAIKMYNLFDIWTIITLNLIQSSKKSEHNRKT